MRVIEGTTWHVDDARKHVLERVSQCESGCWLWKRAVNVGGYGHANVPRGARLIAGIGQSLAHRLAYESFVGPIPDGLFVCHKCDVPACCSPCHLFLGTHRDNVVDMMAKGRGNIGSRHGCAKLDEPKVAHIKRMLSTGATQRSIAAKFGVSQRLISGIKRGRFWRHVEETSP